MGDVPGEGVEATEKDSKIALDTAVYSSYSIREVNKEYDMKLSAIKSQVAAKLGIAHVTAKLLRKELEAKGLSASGYNFTTKQSWKDALSALSFVSDDNLSYIQAARFAKRFNLEGLRMVKGQWVADDDGEAYSISAANYYGAKESGDLAA